MARSRVCGAHTHRTLVPVEKHHLQPQSRGGPSVPDNMVTVCANAHGNIHYLLDTIEAAAHRLMKTGPISGPGYQWRWADAWEAVPDDVKATYNHDERRLALNGWKRYAEAFMAGQLAREFHATTTMGTARTEPVD